MLLVVCFRSFLFILESNEEHIPMVSLVNVLFCLFVCLLVLFFFVFVFLSGTRVRVNQ